MSRRLPPELRDGQYRNWEVAMTTRYPLALSEMRWPSAPLDTFETEARARWGIEIHAGWRPIMERMLERLEAEIARQPPDKRDGFRIAQIKEKFDRLTVHLASEATPEMRAAIQEVVARLQVIVRRGHCFAETIPFIDRLRWGPHCPSPNFDSDRPSSIGAAITRGQDREGGLARKTGVRMIATRSSRRSPTVPSKSEVA